MRSDRHLLWCLCLVLPVAACDLATRTRVEQPAADRYPGQEEALDFWDTLEVQTVTTNDDALNGYLLLVQADPMPATWDERVAAARQRGWLPAESDPPAADESAKMGLMAICACRILDVQGGLSMRLFGPNGRYCTRELVHMGLIPGITEHEALSGSEFIALISAVERRQMLQQSWDAREAGPPDTPPTAPSGSPDDSSEAHEDAS